MIKRASGESETTRRLRSIIYLSVMCEPVASISSRPIQKPFFLAQAFPQGLHSPFFLDKGVWNEQAYEKIQAYKCDEFLSSDSRTVDGALKRTGVSETKTLNAVMRPFHFPLTSPQAHTIQDACGPTMAVPLPPVVTFVALFLHINIESSTCIPPR